MTDDVHTLWFQDPDAWVEHCTEAYHLANNVALPVIAATAEGETGDRVSCVVNTDGHPRDVEERMREVARKLRDLAAFQKLLYQFATRQNLEPASGNETGAF